MKLYWSNEIGRLRDALALIALADPDVSSPGAVQAVAKMALLPQTEQLYHGWIPPWRKRQLKALAEEERLLWERDGWPREDR